MSDEVKPWDLLNPNEPRSDKDLKEERLAICKACTHFNKQLRKCTKCGCFMDLKTTLERASCPVGMW